MFSKIKIYLVLLFTFTIIFTNTRANELQNTSNIAVVNVEEILDNSLAVIDFKNALNTEKESLEKQFKDKQEALADKRATIEKKAQIISQEQLQSEIESFQQEVAKLQEEAGKAEEKMQTKTITGLQKIKEKLSEIVKEMLNEDEYKQYKIVANANSLLYFDGNIDLTKEVLKRFNKKYKTFNDLENSGKSNNLSSAADKKVKKNKK